jgi:levansucrase
MPALSPSPRHRGWLIRLFCAAAVAATLAACGGSDDDDDASSDQVVQPDAEDAPADNTLRFDGGYISLWTPEHMRSIAQDESNTFPALQPADDLFAPELYTWDGWPIRNPDGSVAQIDGWVVYVALSAPRSADSSASPDASNVFYSDLSRWRYWFTRDGVWQRGGLVFPEGSELGARQWAGSTLYDPETRRVTFFYTAVGIVPGGTEQEYPTSIPEGNPAFGLIAPVIQQMVSTTAAVVTDDSGIRFTDFTPHTVDIAADGKLYQTFAQYQAEEVVYGMRDPEYFRDPKTGTEYLLFTANTTLAPGPKNGAIGIAEKQANGSWQLLPPLIVSPGVNSQLERPHVVVKDDKYYIFFSTHDFTFEDVGAGPEGLYGFVSTGGDFRGTYRPLNGHGLVLGNPEALPRQSYSYLLLPTGHVMSYVNRAGDTSGLPGGWVGSPGPLVQIEIDGDATRLVDVTTPQGVDRAQALRSPVPLPFGSF